MMPAFRTMIIAGVLSAVLPSMRVQAQAGPISYLIEPIPDNVSATMLAPIGGGPEADLLIACPALNVVKVGIADSGGTTHVFTNLSVATGPIALAAGDLDGDGDADIVSLNATQVSVLLRNGLTAVRTDLALANAASTAISLPDIDADGDLDLLRGTVVRLNNGAGGFSASSTLVTFNGLPGDALPGDFNGDGRVDLLHPIVAANLSAELYPGFAGGVFPPNAFWTSALTQALYQGYYSTTLPSVRVADMDADGRDDVVVVAFGVDRVTEVAVWRGQQGAGFGLGSSLRVTTTDLQPFTLRPQIFDADGDQDLDVLFQVCAIVAPHGAFPKTAIARNDGMGQLLAPMASPIPVNDYTVAGDVDLNGFVDCGGASSGNWSDFTWFMNGGISTGPASITLTKTFGDNQTVNPGQNLTLYFNLTDGAGQSLIPSELMPEVIAVDSQGIPMQIAYVPLGGWWVSVNAGYDGGPALISISLPPAAPIVYTVNVLPATLTAQSGMTQTAANGTAFGAPLIARITDAQGAGLYAPIRFTLPPGIVCNGSSSSSTEVVVNSDANGFASIEVSAANNALAGVQTVTATVANSAVPPVAFSLTTSGAFLFAPVSGSGQALDAGEAPAPIVWSVLTPAGLPAINMPFTVTTNPASAAAPLTVFSDGQGNVGFTPNIPSGFLGQMSFTIGAGGYAVAVPATIFVRGLQVTRPATASFISITYMHENGPQPLILAVDAPNILPTPTPYGVIATSILQPQPTLHVYDATGAYGVFDPTLVANPTCLRNATIPSAMIGTTWTFQIYGLDVDDLPNLPAAIFISNPVTVTL